MGIYKQNGTKAWIWRKRIEGKVFVKSTRTTNRSLAEKIAREYDREALEQRLLGELESIRFGEALDKYFDARKHTSSASTIYNHIQVIRRHFDMSAHAEAISSADIGRFVHARRAAGIAENTIRIALTTIRGCFRLLDELGNKSPWRFTAQEAP